MLSCCRRFTAVTADHTTGRKNLSSSLTRSKKEIKVSNKRTWIEDVANVRSPHLWYPAARAMKPRTITCHVGPTNSGKTYAALQALKTAKTGIYCGPLRLLAWEVTEILRASEYGDSGDSIACNLITGQEKDIMPGATHSSCTVEMTNLSDEYDCAVIDEMQLIGSRDRGWAWTQALLGLQCKNIHVCGNATFLPLLRQICEDTGDQLVVNRYNRLSPLIPATSALESYSNIEPGDCVVGFSRSKLYQIKASVEKELNRHLGGNKLKERQQIAAAKRRDTWDAFDLEYDGKKEEGGKWDTVPTHDSNSRSNRNRNSGPVTETKCCVIYGSLPPDTRKNQAALFNQHQQADVNAFSLNSNATDVDTIGKSKSKNKPFNKGNHKREANNSVLVATDAIGMGLNLSIRRIIFSSMMKFDGREHRDLHPTEVKQIAGRAGRFCGNYSEGGIVTTYYQRDLEYLCECLNTPDEDIVTAGILPTLDHLQLLHVLVAYNVTQAQLDAFYSKQLDGRGSGKSRRGGPKATRDDEMMVYEASGSTTAPSTTGQLLEHFGSIRRFVEELTGYLSDIYFQIDMLDHSAAARSSQIPEAFQQRTDDSASVTGIRKGKRKQQQRQQLPRENVKFSELLNLYHQSQKIRDREEQHQYPSYADQSRYYWQATPSASFEVSGATTNIAGNDTANTNTVEMTTSTASVSDVTSKYSICELDEMIQISQLLDQFSNDELSMPERYQWCLAPINLDNELLLSLFTRWAEEFVDSASDGGEQVVHLHLNSRNLSRYRHPDTPEALLQLEKLHQSMETYIWLGFRFGPEIFVDMEEAQQCCHECRKLIELGLELVGKKRNTEEKNNRSGGDRNGSGGEKSRGHGHDDKRRWDRHR